MLEKTSQGNTEAQNNPLAYSAQELADRLGASLRHIRRLNSAQMLPRPICLGRSVRWPVQEIKDWMAAGAPDRQRWEAMKRAGR